MKKSIFLWAISIVVVFAIAGCGKDKDDLQGSGSATATPTAVKKVDITARKQAFETKVASLAQYGLDVNRTTDSQTSAHYLIEVKDAQKTAQALLVWLNAGNTTQRDRKIVEKLFHNMKHFGMDVDWVKYAQNKPQSVFVYLVGSGKEKESMRSLIQQKALGAYLSYDEKERLTEVDIKDIDSKITEGNITTKVVLKGAKALISKMPTAEDPASKMRLEFGAFQYKSDTSYMADSNKATTKTVNFSYENGSCDVDKSNSYLGEIACRFPSFSFGEEEENESITMHSEAWRLKTASSAKKGKIQSDGFFEIGKIEIQNRDDDEPVTVAIHDLKLEALGKNIDESLIQALYTLASTPQKDSNQSITKTMKLVGDMFSKGLHVDYLFSIASIEGQVGKIGQSKQFKVDAIEEKGTVAFTKTYDFKDMLTVKGVSVVDEVNATTLFVLKGLRFGTQIAKLYNFIPEFMEFSGALAQHPTQAEPTEEEMKKLSDIGMKMVHNGFSIAYSPLSLEKIKIAEAKVDYGKMQLDLNATLKPNSVKLANAMSAMQLLGFLQADGRLVLSKADLENMSNSFPPQVMAMVMLYAKYEEGKAIFVLKFENGHLLVNDKPVM